MVRVPSLGDPTAKTACPYLCIPISAGLVQFCTNNARYESSNVSGVEASMRARLIRFATLGLYMLVSVVLAGFLGDGRLETCRAVQR